MEIIRGKDFYLKNSCVTIGKFDGIHIGHQRIIHELTGVSREHGLKSVVLSFDYSYFNSDAGDRLNTYEEKKNLLEAYGIDYFWDYPFDNETKSQSPGIFAERVLKEKLDAKAVIVGENFRFGKGAKGDVHTLEKLGREFGFTVYIIPLVKFGGEMVSSTRIRDEIRLGHLFEANHMLFS